MNNQNHQISTNVSEKRFSENGLGSIRTHSLESHSPFSLTTAENEKSFKDYLGILQRHALMVFGVVSVSMVGVTYLTITTDPVYQESFQLLVEPIDNDGVGKLNLTDNVPLSSGSGLDYESQIQVLRSPEKLQAALEKLQRSYPDISYFSLMSNLSIRRLGSTKILEVSYKDNDPKKIKLVLDILSEHYLKYSLDQRQTKLRQGLQFVDKQLPDIRNRVVQLQKELQIFRQRHNFIDPESQSSSISSQIQSLTQQRLDLNQQIVIARYNYLNLQQPEGQLLAINSSENYQRMVLQQRDLDTKIALELSKFQADNPFIVSLREKRDSLTPLIQQEARRAVTAKLSEASMILEKVETNNKLLEQTEKQLQQKLTQLPVLTRQYTDIQRNLELANESLTRFLANREKLQIEVAQTELPWTLIRPPAAPILPISPNIPRNLLLGMVMSSLLGLGFAWLLEEIDNTYHNADQLKDQIKLPILGILPFDKTISLIIDKSLPNKQNHQTLEVKTDKLPSQVRLSNNLDGNLQSSYSYQSHYYGQGVFWEALQVLYSNIQLLNSDSPISSLVISSALPGDGKSTVSFYLAQIAASMGKKVLLVDADLRIPSIHNFLGLKNLWGLSNLISTNIPAEQIIQEIPDLQNLSILTAGPIPPDPGRLLSSDKMKQLMNYFQDNFDLVIYDAPPMLGLVDARLLAPYTDGMMLVVRMDKTDKSAVMQLEDTLKVNVLGLVVNGDKKQTQNYSSYYGYYNSDLSQKQVSMSQSQ